MSQPPDDHLKALWQGQKKEIEPMSINAIHEHVRKERLFRWSSISGVCTVGAGTIPMFAWRAWASPDTLSRTGYLIILAGFAWLLWRNLQIWLKPPAENSSGTVLLNFLREQLLRQQRQTGVGGTVVTGAPIMIGLLMVIAGMSRLIGYGGVAVILGIIVIWAFGMGAILWLNQNRIKARLDELDRQVGR